MLNGRDPPASGRRGSLLQSVPAINKANKKTIAVPTLAGNDGPRPHTFALPTEHDYLRSSLTAGEGAYSVNELPAGQHISAPQTQAIHGLAAIPAPAV